MGRKYEFDLVIEEMDGKIIAIMPTGERCIAGWICSRCDQFVTSVNGYWLCVDCEAQNKRSSRAKKTPPTDAVPEGYEWHFDESLLYEFLTVCFQKQRDLDESSSAEDIVLASWEAFVFIHFLKEYKSKKEIEVFYRHYVEGETFKSIGESFGRTGTTISNWMNNKLRRVVHDLKAVT